MMSAKSPAQKELVLQRLVLAADEIFALFERTFAECERQFVRTGGFVQNPPEVLHKEDLLSSRAQGANSSDSFINKSLLISVKTQALKDLVVERLVVAADEIFLLFERTFAQFEEEVLHSRFIQPPPEALHKQDFQTVIVGLNVGTDQTIKEEPVKIKQEADPPIEINYSSVTVKSEEVEPEEHAREPSGEPHDGEEPGCSTDLSLDSNNKRPYSSSDTDDSDNMADETTTSNAEENKAEKSHNSTENIVKSVASSSSNTPVINNNNSNAKNQDKPVPKCNLCYKTFKSTKALERHLEFHPGPFTCEICSKVHSDRSNYKKHLRIHAEQKPFRCSVCERGFTQKRHMNEHMRIHTGEKPLSCSDCGMTFRQKNSLMRHVLSKHSEHKPYACPICMKGFVQKWHLVVHMRGHTGERPFSCTVCARSFESKCYLKKHMDRNHKSDGEIPNEVLDSGLCPSLDWEQETIDT